jgi:cytochrome b561
MRIRSSEDRYGTVAATIHWVTALAIVLMLASGLAASNAADEAAELGILRVHAIMGVCVLVLTILRLLWWWLGDKRPGDPPAIPAWQKRAAHFVHGSLYVVIIVMAASGIATLMLSGASQQVFGGAPLPLPELFSVPPMTAHAILWRVLAILVIGHVGAALYHQFIRRDRLLARMRIGG